MPETRVSFALKQYAARIGVRNLKELSKNLGVRRGTLREWWIGESPPRSLMDRQKLYKATGDPLFEGSLTKKKHEESMQPPSEVVPTTNDENERVDRLVSLIRIMQPDLVALVVDGSEGARRTIRKKLGQDFELHFNGVRALASEANRSVLEKEGLLKKLTSKGRGGD